MSEPNPITPEPKPKASRAKADMGNVYQRRLAVLAELSRVKKAGKTEFGERFAYAKHDDVMEAVRGLLCEHGLGWDFEPLNEAAEWLEHGTTKAGNMQWRLRLPVRFWLTNVDDPDDRTPQVEIIGEGIDTGDKAVGKALSYATKNDLLKVFLLPSGEEAENEAHDTTTARPAQQRSRQRQAGAAEGGTHTTQATKPTTKLGQMWGAVKRANVDVDKVFRPFIARAYQTGSTGSLSDEQLDQVILWAAQRAGRKEKLDDIFKVSGRNTVQEYEAICKVMKVETVGLLTLAEWDEVIASYELETPATSAAAAEAAGGPPVQPAGDPAAKPAEDDDVPF